jgi:DNA-binding XRE family transcriptional regulator
MILNYSKYIPAETRALRQKIAVYMGKGFTQKEIADIMGVSQGTISNHEKEISKFGEKFAYMLAKENGMARLMFDSIVGFQSVIHDLEMMKAETFEVENTETNTITRRPILGGNAMVAACRVQMECYQKIYEMAKQGPFIIGAKKIQAEFEEIKRNARSGKEIDVHPLLNNKT